MYPFHYVRPLIRIIYRILSGFLLAWTVSLPPVWSSTSSSLLESIEMYPALDGDALEIRYDHPFHFVTYTLTEPDRLIIDPVDPVVRSGLDESHPLNGLLARGWKVHYPAGAADSDQVDYLSVELSQPSEHLIERANGRLLVRLRPKHPLYPFALRPASPLGPEGGTSSPVEGRQAADQGRFWTFQEALSFGLDRHRPVRIATEEVELAEMKVREARRALYPSAKLRFTWTEGTASELDFTEYQTGLQMEHPLYYSGRLMETYRQSLVNLQVAEKRKAKVKADYALEVAEAYYELMGAQANLSVQEGLIEEAQRVLDQVEARLEKKLLTPLERLNVQAQLNQARFQRANAENDLLLARMKLHQRLELQPDAAVSVEVPPSFPPPSDSPIDLEEALQLSRQYRSDIQINALLVEFHEFEERIQEAKGKLQVDLSGFFGSSASAFETEPLDSGDDYFIGVKAKRNWGPHGMEVNVTDTHTSPRLGQTTRTDSTVYSAEMGILDKLESFSEVQQARINLAKARRDLAEARATVYREVQEAYISFQKARLQLEYARQKIQFRQEQAKIVEAQASLNEALPSQVLEAVMKVREEQVGEVQALTAYYVALAKLNKAIGLTGHYQGAA